MAAGAEGDVPAICGQLWSEAKDPGLLPAPFLAVVRLQAPAQPSQLGEAGAAHAAGTDQASRYIYYTFFGQLQCCIMRPPICQVSSRNYAVLRKRLTLTLDDVDEQEPADIAYVHSVYAPLSVRLVQGLNRPGGWRSIRDVLDLLPGPTVEETQPSVARAFPTPGTRSTTLVLFLGGCTYAEISALRYTLEED